MTPRSRSRHRARGLLAVSATALVLTVLVLPGPGRAPRAAAAAADDPPKKVAPPAPAKSALPPLESDRDEPPLLLEKPVLTDAKPENLRAADNSACHVCHTNYKKEPLAASHAGRGVGCVRCHGASEAHRNDENNITPPETMYPLPKIDDACRNCHKQHNVPARTVVARFLDRKAPPVALDRLVCTECHGAHRLPRRTVVWNRATGKLVTGNPAPASPK
jgi:hypothetical protein